MAALNKAVPDGKWHKFPEVEPEEEGLYFVRRVGYNGFSYSYWDGKEWKAKTSYLEIALERSDRSYDMYNYHHEWCGAK